MSTMGVILELLTTLSVAAPRRSAGELPYSADTEFGGADWWMAGVSSLANWWVQLR